MPTDPRAELRALALWHTRRRSVDELLLPLLEYGPVAVDRVADRILEMQVAMSDEQRAFEAFVQVLGERQQTTAVVLEMFGRSNETHEVVDS